MNNEVFNNKHVSYKTENGTQIYVSFNTGKTTFIILLSVIIY